MPILLLTVALQVIAVVHLFRTGRNMTWLFLIILVPMVGCHCLLHRRGAALARTRTPPHAKRCAAPDKPSTRTAACAKAR